MTKRIPGGNLSCFYDPQLKREVVKIKPGEYFATTHPYVIATVLGSCVSACIRDTVRGGCGMNHFMLPDQGASARASGGSSLRYGAFAMESLINEFIKRGSQRTDLEAKVFGGAAVLEMSEADVGAQNAAFVLDYLATEGIRVSVADLGGTLPRKLMQYVEDGRVLVKYLKKQRNDTIKRGEAEYARSLQGPMQPTSVDLF